MFHLEAEYRRIEAFDYSAIEHEEPRRFRRLGLMDLSECLRRKQKSGKHGKQNVSSLNHLRLPGNLRWKNTMKPRLSDDALEVLFRNARTHHAWLPQPVTDEELRALYELVKWGPTSANTCPARFLFLRTPEAKQRLLPALSPGNVEKTRTAPVTAIIGYDLKFYEKLTKLFPHNPAMRENFAKSSPQAREIAALRNGTLQGGYFILAARALGLDCGPMSGFDNAKVDAEFFPEGNVKSNFLCNLCHGDSSKLL